MRNDASEKAKQHLQDCVQIKYGIMFRWANAYFERMERDSSWPKP